jgi:hypothetical protein
MTAPVEDFSREALAAILGDDVMDHLRALADASPDPHPDEYDKLRRLFAPVVRRVAETAPAAEHAAA